MRQEFYVTLRVITNPETTDNRKVTEKGMELMLKKALNPDKVDDRIKEIRFGDVIDMTK